MRTIEPFVEKDLRRKMVFISGPRQCGKTYLALQILERSTSGIYLNWDDPDHQKLIRKRDWNDSDSLIVLDEIHKFSKWKNFVKGTYDTQKSIHRFLVTGSARLDVDRRGGDSLLGRYYHYRLHPFCLAEKPVDLKLSSEDYLSRLLQYGGFPEPLLDGDAIGLARWSRERKDKIIKDDIRDLGAVRDISGLYFLFDALAQRVGNEIVHDNISSDLQVAPKTIKAWINIFETMYIGFAVRPYSNHLPRALQKPYKFYFYHQGDLECDDGFRLENLVANHLFKRVHFLEDTTGEHYELCFIRDRENREVDFVITKKKKPIVFIEVKSSDHRPSNALAYFSAKFEGTRRIQLVRNLDRDITKSGIEIKNMARWLSRPLSEGFV